MTTVATFPDLPSAELAAGLLQAEGIPASIPNAQLVGIDWRLSNAVGGIVLKVPPEHEQRARELLASIGEAITLENGGDSPLDEAEVLQPACPQCGSRNTAPDRSARRLLALSLLFPPAILLTGPAYFLSRGRYQCSACRQLWTPPKQGNAV